MPRRPRVSTGGYVFHVLNRRVGHGPLFEKPSDYSAFEKIMQEAYDRTGIRIVAYCLMPNHWHLLVWPREDGELSEIMRWITVTHTQRWHAHHESSGTGPIYQGRFKSFPVETSEHFLTVARYVERNPLRANLVQRAEDWQWSSLWRHTTGRHDLTMFLSPWPLERPRDWHIYVNQSETEAELEALRSSAKRGRPFGSFSWVEQTTKHFGLEFTWRQRGRPKRRQKRGRESFCQEVIK